MPGTILQVLVKVGDAIQEDDELFVMEAMKMEVPVVAPSGGTVTEIHVQEKDAVKAHQLIAVIA
jgi:biotin carboxyl carrier protein